MIEDRYTLREDRFKLERGEVQEVVDKLAAELDYQPKLFFDRSGIIADPLLTSVFETMQARSLEGRYQTQDGRQRLFYHMPFDGQSLIDIVTPESEEARLDQLATFAGTIPAYVDRANTRIVQKRRLGPDSVYEHAKIWDQFLPDRSDKEAFMKNFIESHIENTRGERSFWWPDVFEAMVLFGNPDEELVDKYGSKAEIPTNGKYPILTPIFDITLAPDVIPEDPFKTLDDYNGKIGPYMSEIYDGKIKIEDVMTLEEIRFASQSRSIVSLMNKMTYPTTVSGTMAPHLEGIVVAPLFPLEQLRRHDSYTWEHWGTGIANDFMNETLHSYPATAV